MSNKNNEDFSDINLGKILADIEALNLSDSDKDSILTALYDMTRLSGLLDPKNSSKQNHEIFSRLIIIASRRLVESGMDPEELKALQNHAKKFSENMVNEFGGIPNEPPSYRPRPKTNENNLNKEVDYLNELNKKNDPITKSDIQDLVIDLNTTQDVMDFINKL